MSRKCLIGLLVTSCFVSSVCAQRIDGNATYGEPLRATESEFGSRFGDPGAPAEPATPDETAVPESRADKLSRRDRDLANQTRVLLKQFAEASGDNKTESSDRLRRVLVEHFDVKQEMREVQLLELEARVRRLRKVHEQRNSAKQAIIDKRLDQITEEVLGLGWDTPLRRR